MKCYTFCCAVCGDLDQSSRRHTLTCSTACRVRLHRQPQIVARVRAEAECVGVPLALVLQAQALKQLCPDLMAAITAGTLSIAAIQPTVNAAFMQLLWAAVARVR